VALSLLRSFTVLPQAEATVRQSNISLRMKKFEVTQKAWKIVSLETMIGDLQALDYDLSLQIAAEEIRHRGKPR